MASELNTVEKQIQDITDAAKEGVFQPPMNGLESRKAQWVSLVSGSSSDVPDILPMASTIYANSKNAQSGQPRAMELI
ncbi:hypothetical protein QCM77_15120 [Bradyrhizobium sp. SSUT18]|uniref:hypothetical protein n=1 Tax=unclassified Bradyrhizobium TaxID=2631580 RepID=UPI002449E329|nr:MULTISPECIES: hypothetical protein [unclassified Bradyrhizobium]MDH2349605.1 hypothetical protein [Bradyrhizobium sp. SSUT112]MDH2401272.1 hypothetical protein [Bradyrhizobium sp. SSUT18]